jgi:hypothetical protein
VALTTIPAAGAKLRGSVLSALVTEVRTLHIYKNADETLSNSAALQNDDAITLTPATSATYIWEAFVSYGAGTTADIQFAWTFPAGASCDWTSIGLDTTSALNNVLAIGYTSGTGKSYGGAGVASFRAVHFFGRLVMGSTGGAFAMQWAQNVATVENTVVKAQSWLSMRRVA